MSKQIVEIGKFPNQHPDAFLKWYYVAIFPDRHYERGALRTIYRSAIKQGFTIEIPEQIFYRTIIVHGLCRQWIEYRRFTPLIPKEIEHFNLKIN